MMKPGGLKVTVISALAIVFLLFMVGCGGPQTSVTHAPTLAPATPTPTVPATPTPTPVPTVGQTATSPCTLSKEEEVAFLETLGVEVINLSACYEVISPPVPQVLPVPTIPQVKISTRNGEAWGVKTPLGVVTIAHLFANIQMPDNEVVWLADGEPRFSLIKVDGTIFVGEFVVKGFVRWDWALVRESSVELPSQVETSVPSSVTCDGCPVQLFGHGAQITGPGEWASFYVGTWDCPEPPLHGMSGFYCDNGALLANGMGVVQEGGGIMWVVGLVPMGIEESQ